MKKKYDPKSIERKWQKVWKEKKPYKVEVEEDLPKYYILDMFPYPSGAGLHVGHVVGYTGTDVIARYMRQKGLNVLHPMGWDSFGLPAEQYAIRTGTHPEVTTEKNIQTIRAQLEALGYSYDWDREVTTSSSDYYKWTQWIFTKLYEKGLAYEAEANVNFCPTLGTVLANEEVEDGKSKEGGYPVERRPLKQWILKITAYADRLLADLDLLDWPEHLKKLQANWIGRSEGANIAFVEITQEAPIFVFTTRADTLFGVTYLVLSPEHPLVDQITTDDQKEVVSNYKRETLSKSDLDRTDLAKEKTGVWTGTYALHPITKEKLPIWIADYVLMNYGTGAVMAVPSHDERDFEFALKYHLPKVVVIEPDLSEIDPESITSPKEVKEAVLSGKMCWSGGGKLIQSSHGELHLNGLSSEIAKARCVEWLGRHGGGRSAVQYKLRDWLFSRQRYWGEPIPILHFEDGSMRALGQDELPLIPPPLEDFKPAPTGESPLSKVRSWVEVIDAKTGRPALRETNTMPQWAGSCWYYLRFCDAQNPSKAWGEKEEKYWMPVDLYVGGVEHAVLHLLYARFWHKVLYDLGEVHTPEPFLRLRNQGLVTARSFKLSQGGYVAPSDVVEKDGKAFYRDTEKELIVQTEKMSKSKLNGVSPDDMIEEFGADALRLYSMFMGPFDKEKVWNTDAVSGCRRFLSRFFEMVQSEKVGEGEHLEAKRLTHKLANLVRKEIEAMEFNTAIAHMMEYLNAFLPLPVYPKECLKMSVQTLYPFAPHLAEELWEMLGETSSLTKAPLYPIDPKLLVEDTALYVVQVNGKLRGRFDLPKNKTEKELLELVKKTPEVEKHLSGEIVKTIFVPNKLLNIVVK